MTPLFESNPADDALTTSKLATTQPINTNNTVKHADAKQPRLNHRITNKILVKDSLIKATPAVAFVALKSASEASRFLAQASMGATRAQITQLQKIGFSAWLQQQFALPLQGSHYNWLVANKDPETGKLFTDIAFKFNQNGFDASVWRKFLSSTDTLRQRIVFALSEILVVSIDGLDAYWPQFRAATYMDTLEKHAFGNYRQLLTAISTSPAMAQYLTFLGNEKQNLQTGANPDENYAREMLQLFTIGLNELNIDGTKKLNNGQAIETYNQKDISQLARVFTGWEWDPPNVGDRPEPSFAKRPLKQVADWHETGASSFLGGTVPAGLDGATSLKAALDITFAHPNVAPFISRQLIQKLVTSNPVPAYVARVAKAFNNNGAGIKGDMKAVITAILLDDEARNASNLTQASFGKVREPVLRFCTWARAFNIVSPNKSWDIGWVRSAEWGLAQAPLHAATVFNFSRPGYVPPNSAIATAGLVAPELQITNETSVIGYINFMQNKVSSYSNFANSDDKDKNMRVDYSALKKLAVKPIGLVNELNLVLTANQLSAATVNLIVNAITQITDDANNRVYAAILLVLAAPEFIVSK